MLNRALRSIVRPQRNRGSQLHRCHGTVVSYYDSQSGQHVTYTDAIHIHGLHFGSLDEVTTSVQGLDSITATHANIKTLPLEHGKPVYLTYPPWTPSSSSPPLAVNLSCTSPREDWNDVLAQCAAATKLGLPIKATLAHAFASSDVTIQLAGSLLADAGVGIITLDDSVDQLADEDNLLEAFEALTWCDVVGLPMKQRIGFRGSAHTSEDLLLLAVQEHEIKHFDVCLQGGVHAVTPSHLAQVLDTAGVPHHLVL
ncbi:hypothetical protein H257_13848 [Aphanomyces astaci]|uniref:Uncharacterized protein n=2 Tax=Aphanomyces astaci TaxID=112090 RepID=W4FTH5_APHAT|nr:hypothetical protein H257_13848 [Aphanomyces astaci]ETV70762.1 hypothetical protein H257_13848 [Aphanomyces astaci]RHY00690.1 hypothetical protein DYB36_003951 [Aphanomyces astaci]RHY03931.1 hypothetical protein DYB25_005166 [Aphanomyces astaci]RHY44509.1 hypothetical protein DYB30_010936 [Aphanomyces astaci]RHY45955.1 hypothetical protein DYB34_006367 [Aphanomyces astaci]|eukprot:XP_009839826.1 hypothetical protein H257_13848 [Aphanomyces astaci]